MSGLSLKAHIDLDGSGFERTIHKIEHATSHMAGHVGGELRGLALQAFGLYGVEQAFEKTAEMAKDLVNESKRLGVGVEQLQLLKQAAKDGGTEMEMLVKKFEELDVSRQKALGHSQEAPKLLARFAQLGISKDDLHKKTAAQLFMGPMRNAANTMNQEDLGPVLKDIVGKGFGQLIPVLKTDFDDLEKTMRKLGVIMDTETAVKMKKLGDEFELLSKIVLVTLGPALVRFAEWVLEIVSKSKLVEGLDFLVRQHNEVGKLPGYGEFTAGERHEEAVKALEKMRQAEIRKEPYSEFKARRDKYTDSQFYYNKSGVFGDDKSTNYREGLNYLEGLINPVAEASNKAATGASEDMKHFQESLAKMREEMAKEINELKNPKPPVFDPAPPDGAPAKHKMPAGGDALIRVGNFLGSSRNSLHSISERQLGVMQRIEANTRASIPVLRQALVTTVLRLGIPPI